MVLNYSFITIIAIWSNLTGLINKLLLHNDIVSSKSFVFYNSPKFPALGLALLGFVIFLIYHFFNIKKQLGNFIEKEKENKTSDKEYLLYFLFLGITIIVIEIINEIFKNNLHSIYIRGSVPKGTSIQGISDFDLIVAVFDIFDFDKNTNEVSDYDF